MDPRFIGPLSPNRSPSRRRQLPAAMLAGLAVLFAVPLLGNTAPQQLILGTSVTAHPTAAPSDRTPGIGQKSRNSTMLTDPGGENSLPAGRLAPPIRTLTGYRWPLRNASLTLPFGPTKYGTMIVAGELFHDGIDLATWCGDHVKAAHAGTVLAAGRDYDQYMGWVGDLTAYTSRLNKKHLWLSLPNVVVIDDGNGYRSIYAHFRYVAVAPGDVVAAGDYLGTEGLTGRSSGCHLHYGLFSPYAVDTFALEPIAAAHMLLPTDELARIDPLLVLPPLKDAGIH